MIAIPAVDLRDGACVQLVGGSYAEERVRLTDPVAVARRWADAGFTWLHVVDLDAATGAGDNETLVDHLIELEGLDVQVGGGIRTSDRVRDLLDRGAARVVVGTRAIENPEWLEAVSASHPGRVVVAADVRGREVVTHGWTRSAGVDAAALVSRLSVLPLAGIFVTAVEYEGKLGGTDLPVMEELIGLSRLPVIASGGIATLEDLRALESLGTYAAVLGMALYTGALEAGAVAREFAE